MSAVREALAARFSCRAFRPDPVPPEVIARIVDAARLAPSWSNTQPWGLVIARPETTKKLAERLVALAAGEAPAAPDVPFPPGFDGVYLARRREVGFGLYAALGIAREDRAGRARQHLENFRFFGAPHVAALTMPAGMGPYGALDAGSFLQSFLLAAAAEGVATIAQAALAAYSPALHEALEIGADRSVLCGVAFGYADEDHPANRFRATRAPREEIVRFV